ncbi:hypothetical protein SAMN05444000_12739 [Shimia gijangensis]|uniref:Uncharacterized protein n=1 Tax=Shimia gijangensis TaxID=1470563 RepID=A0A1M6S3X1_9RHOB|nr:hypothetical protein [Shimia gijangensis]SHK39157.1 hypothetical protein SAMN05444000_12739 [Shimia gijangensis]
MSAILSYFQFVLIAAFVGLGSNLPLAASCTKVCYADGVDGS